MIPSTEQRRIPSPFQRLLLTDYWDGPLSGLAIDAEGAMWLFDFLDWDDQHGMRVFSFGIVPQVEAGEIEAAFSLIDAAVWVLPALDELPPIAETLFQRAEATACPTAVVASADLLESIEVWRPMTERPSAPPSEGWLESLGLPRSGSTL